MNWFAAPRRLALLLILSALLTAGCGPTAAPASAPTAAPTKAPLVTPGGPTLTPFVKATLPPTWTLEPTGTPLPANTLVPIPSERPTLRAAVGPTTSSASSACKGTLVGGQTPRIPSISLNNLAKCHPEVTQTLSNIQKGQFRSDQDDGTFQNREKLLPAAPNGTYREYTVVTPGSSDRGARRIITSGSPNRKSAGYQSIYFTDDHYASFWLVIRR